MTINRKISVARKRWWRDHPEARKRMRGPENPTRGAINFKGEHNPFFGVHRFGSENPNWKGGCLNSFKGGRIRIYQADSNKANNTQYQFEYRSKAEKALGRPLQKNEVVHHINGDPADDRNQNLVICTNNYHLWLHAQMKKIAVKT